MARKCNQVLVAKAHRKATKTLDRAACKREKYLGLRSGRKDQLCDAKKYPERKRVAKVLDFSKAAKVTEKRKTVQKVQPKVAQNRQQSCKKSSGSTLRTVSPRKKEKPKCHKCKRPVTGRIPKTKPAPGRPRTYPWCRTCVLKAANKHKLRTVRTM